MARSSTGLLVGANHERGVPLRGRITKPIAACCIARLLVLATEQPGRPVIIYIDSPGGPAKDSLSILSTMNGIRCPIATFCLGDASGTAAVIAARGTPGFRTAHPNARFSFRRPAPAKSAHDASRDQKLLPLLAEMLAKDLAKPKAEVLAWLTNGAEFTAEQALAHHLVDRVSPTPLLPDGV